jgi:hypothetical protein
MKTGEYKMHRFEPIIGQWRIVATNLLLLLGIDLMDLELTLKIFILICSAVVSVITIMIKWKQWKKLK